MRVLVIGANGKVGQKLVKKLAHKNHEVVAMIRDEKQEAELQAKGAHTVVADLEKDISPAFKKKPDVVVFVAGSGSGTGQDKTVAVDLQGARKSIDEAVKHHVDRYVMLSVLGANDAKSMPADMQHYFVAKSEADQHLVQSGINYTIFRPGRLTDDAGNGSVKAAESLDDTSGSISRDNLATAMAESIDMANTHKKVIELLDGDTPIKNALSKI